MAGLSAMLLASQSLSRSLIKSTKCENCKERTKICEFHWSDHTCYLNLSLNAAFSNRTDIGFMSGTETTQCLESHQVTSSSPLSRLPNFVHYCSQYQRWPPVFSNHYRLRTAVVTGGWFCMSAYYTIKSYRAKSCFDTEWKPDVSVTVPQHHG